MSVGREEKVGGLFRRRDCGCKVVVCAGDVDGLEVFHITLHRVRAQKVQCVARDDVAGALILITAENVAVYSGID